MHYFGYHPIGQLPVKKGDIVLVPRGTFVRSLNPSIPTKPAGRSYKVKVNHMLCGMEVQVGHVYEHDGFHEACWHGDLDAIRRTYGTDEISSLWPCMKVRNNIVFLPVSNPSVCWAGSGGYWCDADINDVEKVQ